MEIRTEVHQGIMDAELLKTDIIQFLNNNAEWGDDCPITNFKTKHSFNGYRAHYFSIGTNLYSKNYFDYKLYHEVFFETVEAFRHKELLYWMFGGAAPIQVSSPKIKLKDVGDHKEICVSFITKVL